MQVLFAKNSLVVRFPTKEIEAFVHLSFPKYTDISKVFFIYK